MGGKLKGHRMMITVPEEVYPDLVELSELSGMPPATFVRLMLKDFGPQLRVLTENIKRSRQGDHTGALLGLTSHLLQSQHELLGLGAESIREASQIAATVSMAVAKDKPKTAAKRPRKRK